MFSIMIVPDFINSTENCGIITPKYWFEDVNTLHTWKHLNVGKLNVRSQYWHMGPLPISLIDDLSYFILETGYILHLILHHIWRQSNTPGLVISYFVNSTVDNYTYRVSERTVSSTPRPLSIISSSS